ncbi:MAG: acetate--CoA ligase family protein [Proteobacteria bacterium]|nr:acetate--CoA ligase family protein [Pseudomonadota bacterium]MBU1582226.1 acetate--CoA ligase family protein [Pseudomonadota bacterium]MBU2455388.1 acetate--CoA ligase family protein [Pseudomonadota bacterium]MBU2631897.1 acetate--CoA ligase family protein [Pseudomonadota bacterium]
MDLPIDFNSITQMLASAARDGRDFLYEYEVYTLLSQSGAETPPQCNFILRGSRPSDEALTALPGEKTVLKIVSPFIIHKTEVGGVRIVKKETHQIRSALRRMFYEVPENYAAWIQRHPDSAPPPYKGLLGDALIAAISRDIKGILQVQFMPPDSDTFGNELIVGLRHTREFGTIISAGLGGTDTELYAKRFRKGQAIVAASVEMTDGQTFFQLFKQTISYRKLAGLTRGQRRIVTDEQLIECFESFIRMGTFYSQANPSAPFVIEELEINPFAFSDYLMVPLDGLCRFCTPKKVAAKRPIEKIDNLLHPSSIGIIGVSSTRKNFGRIILDNILAEGFSKKNTIIFKEDVKEIDGIRCLPNLEALNHGEIKKLDLFIVAVGAAQVPDLVENLIELDAAQAIMLIPGGMGETHNSQVRAQNLMAKIDQAHDTLDDGGPVFLGANCMGVISKPGGYDTWFIPEEKLPKDRSATCHRAALISQSGAFMLHRSHQYPQMRPAYMISMGNQTDLTLGDMVHYFKSSDAVDVIAVYAEGFNDLDGLEFCKAVRQAVLFGKEVVFYKAGRTPEGKAATSSHTASLAGDYMVCESCVQQAGAIVARTFSEFQELVVLSETLNHKPIKGNRLAAVSGAGFEAVGMADAIQSDDFHMELARFEKSTLEKVAKILKDKRLDAFVTLSNPLDINPAADDDTHAQITQILTEDKGVDAVIVSLDPLSPAMKTLENTRIPGFDMHHEDSIKNQIIEIANTCDTPVITVVDGGRLYDPLRDALIKNNVPVFTVCDKAVAALSLYIQGRLNADAIRSSEGFAE